MTKFAYFILLLLLTGCTAPKQHIVYKEVFIPIKCNMNFPSKPKLSDDVIKNNILIINYTLELEKVLKICIGKE